MMCTYIERDLFYVIGLCSHGGRHVHICRVAGSLETREEPLLQVRSEGCMLANPLLLREDLSGAIQAFN